MFGVYFIECVQTTLALYNVFNVIRLNNLDFSRRCRIVGLSEMVCSVLGEDPSSGSGFNSKPDLQSLEIPVAVTIQAYYVFRIYLFSQKLWLVAMIALVRSDPHRANLALVI